MSDILKLFWMVAPLAMLLFAVFAICFIADVIKRIYHLVMRMPKEKFQSLELLFPGKDQPRSILIIPIGIILGAISILFLIFGTKADFRADFQKREYVQYYNAYIQFHGRDYSYPVIAEVEKNDGMYVNKLFFEDGYMIADPDEKLQYDIKDEPIEIDPYGATALIDFGDIVSSERVEMLKEIKSEIPPFERAKIIGYDFGDDMSWWIQIETGLIHHEDCEKINGYCEYFGKTIDDVERKDFCPYCLNYFEKNIEDYGWW